MTLTENDGCSCKRCRAACTHKPGWFLPGEVEKVADHLGMTLQDLFDGYLAVDWWETYDPTFLLSPAVEQGEPGEEFPAYPRGTCVFLADDGSCGIHPVKPHECRSYMHTDSDREIKERHKSTHLAWGEHQGQIVELLGREPEAEEYEGGLLGLLGF